MRTPHVQGAFRQQIVVEPSQAYRLAEGVSDAEGALSEPLSVALHAVRRAGSLLGKSVLVTGCGPIGALIVIAARRAGATRIVVTDIGAFTLRTASKVGADETLNMAERPDALAAFGAPTRDRSTCSSKPAATRPPCAARSMRCGRAASSFRSGWAAR